MKVVIAMDSFKGTHSSLEVAEFVSKGIRKVYPDAEIQTIGVADGGEGTANVLVDSLCGRMVELTVQNPVGKPVKACYGILPDLTAVIEMSAASGLTLVSPQERNPLVTSTYGTGQMIMDAIEKGCKRIIIGLGGSATNDGGFGMASALGIRFLDKMGNDLALGGGALKLLDRIDMSGLSAKVRDTEFLIACDVENPLCGSNGASAVFGPQKGADDEMVRELDCCLRHYGNKISQELGISVAEAPGAGAAGGMGAGLLAFCNAKLIKGVDLVLDYLEFDRCVQDADIIITGEGRLDSQTIYGKVPVGVARHAKKYSKPVYAIAGFLGDGAQAVYSYGIDAVISAVVAPMSLEEAIQKSPQTIENAAENLMRIILSINHSGLCL